VCTCVHATVPFELRNRGIDFYETLLPILWHRIIGALHLNSM